jgi:predicted  nucleic acid-binding Zn-ribbon protein
MRTWFSPHGTEWVAETYQEALEAERDALQQEIAILTEQRDNHLNRANQRQGEIERLREALELTRTDIRRRLAGDSAIDAPYDEDLALAEQRIDQILDYTQPELGTPQEPA